MRKKNHKNHPPSFAPPKQNIAITYTHVLPRGSPFHRVSKALFSGAICRIDIVFKITNPSPAAKPRSKMMAPGSYVPRFPDVPPSKASRFLRANRCRRPLALGERLNPRSLPRIRILLAIWRGPIFSPAAVVDFPRKSLRQSVVSWGRVAERFDVDIWKLAGI